MRKAKRKTTVPPRPTVTARVNEQITARHVRLVDEDGTQVGVLPLAEALQAHSAPKEVRLRPRIGMHDYAWKRDQAIGFLRARSKVKLVVTFRGRERAHPELGRQLLVRLAADVAEFGHLDGGESYEGRSMTVLLSPNGASR